jgi:peptidoglycan hydrolase-like protein with peptidoglycan-binding domain
MCVTVARTSENALTLTAVRIYFRKYPSPTRGGTAGAIARATYVLRAGDTTVAGDTDDEGSVVVNLAAGHTAQLEIFGTTYEISLIRHLESNDHLNGAQRRLNMLGYWSGAVDNQIGPITDTALLNYQADHALGIRGADNAGHVPVDTKNSLRSTVGR